MNRDEILSEINDIHKAYGVKPEDVSRLTELYQGLIWGDIDTKLSPIIADLTYVLPRARSLIEAGKSIKDDLQSRPATTSSPLPGDIPGRIEHYPPVKWRVEGALGSHSLGESDDQAPSQSTED